MNRQDRLRHQWTLQLLLETPETASGGSLIASNHSCTVNGAIESMCGRNCNER
jgi:hypothetical protein